jgi:hypothetical protein
LEVRRVEAAGLSALAKSRDRLFATGWVHVFEEDTAEGAVFRPEDGVIPLSRRPRERLKLEPDGRASVYLAGPDDRYVEQPATWQDDDGTCVIRTKDGHITIEIVDHSDTKLVAKIHRTGSAR